MRIQESKREREKKGREKDKINVKRVCVKMQRLNKCGECDFKLGSTNNDSNTSGGHDVR